MKVPALFLSIIIISILTGLCYLTADVYSVGFSSSHNGALVLHGIGIVCALLFVFSFISARIISGTYLQPISRFINSIVGIAFYFFLGSIVLSVVLGLGTFSKNESFVLSTFIASLSFILGISGLLQARNIKITSYTVRLTQAPKQWNGKRAVLVSDTHFGLINHKTFSDKVVRRILQLNPDLVLHAGDFYDGPRNNLSLITTSWKKLTEKIPVFYTPGNHERYGDYDSFIKSIALAGITVLEDSLVEHDGVQIAGIVYRGKKDHDKAQSALISLKADSEKPLILINHPPTFHDSALEIKTNLMVSGHTHKGQFWPNTIITRLIYKRFFYGLQELGALTAITTSGVGTAGPPVRLFNTPELVVIHFTAD